MMKKTLNILLLFCLCSICYSAETTYYVDVDVVGGDGDGSSWANAYSSLQTAETARDGDITAGNAVRFLCRNSSGGTDVKVQFLGWTTDADSYIKVEADSNYRHAGVWDASKYHIATTDDYVLDIQEDYVRLVGIQLSETITANNTKAAIFITGITVTNNEFRFSNLIVKGNGTGTGGMVGIQLADADIIAKIWNCVVYNFISASDPADTGFMGMSINCTTTDIWNCTFNDNNRGIRQGNGTVTTVNCLVFENTDDFVGTIAMTYCASDDDHTGDSVTNFVITQTADDYATLVTDADGRDYNVTDGSSELVGMGTDDPGGATQGDTDIAGTARTSTWDVGAFELVAVAGVGQVIFIN